MKRKSTTKKNSVLSLFLTGVLSILLGFGSVAPAYAQQSNIQGTVLDETGEPLIGVSIQVKGTQNGTVTDLDGKFEIKNTAANVVLKASYIGYAPIEMKATKGIPVTIKMENNSSELEEVVITAYGTTKRANLAGSVTSIQSKQIADISTKDLSSALIGQMPGVNVGLASGSPIANSVLQIRINGSWNTEEPLFVIDGFIRDQAAFNILDASEVEDITVLKDASAAIYGSRASGGVVIVTTKLGQEGKTRVSYSGNVGLNTATGMPKMMTARQHAETLNEKYNAEYDWDPTQIENNKSKYYTPSELDAFGNMNNDWLSQAWQSSINTRHTLNVSGGTDKVKYFVGGSYMYQNGNFPGLNANRFSTRVGVDAQLAKDLKGTFQLSYSNKSTTMPYNSTDTEPDRMYGTFGSLLRAPRWIPSYINGKAVGNSQETHALEVLNGGSYQQSASNNITMGANFEYSIPMVKGLKVALSVNYGNSFGGGKRIAKSYYAYNFNTTGENGHIITDVPTGIRTPISNGEGIQVSSSESSNYQINPSISYARKFGKHDISILAMYEQSQSFGTGLSASRKGILIDNYEVLGGYKKLEDISNSSMSNGARQSLIGRLNYTFADRYIIEAAARYEGSTIFAPSVRWGLFPSVSVGWRISEEAFFRDAKYVMDNFKLRASYGRLGNDKANLRAWEQSYTLNADKAYLGDGSTMTSGLLPSNGGVVSSIVTWEKSDAYNVGFDTRFFNRLTFNVDAFYRYTFDILDSPNSIYPTSSGIANIPKSNYGEFAAWGAEIEIGYNHQFNKDWSMSIRGQLAVADNIVIKKFQAAGAAGTFRDEIGRRRGGDVGYECLGIARTVEDCNNYINYLKSNLPKDANGNPVGEISSVSLKEADLRNPGYLMYKDIRANSDRNDEKPDGKIDSNDQTRITDRDSNPINFSATLGAKWKNWSFDIMFNGSTGSYQKYEKAFYTGNSGGGRKGDWLSEKSNNLVEWYNNYWTPANPDARYPKLGKSTMGESSTFWVVNGTVLRIQNVNLSYTLPAKAAKKIHLEQLRVFFNGTNLATIVNPFTYKDPSVSIWSDYPMMASFNLGLNITF